MVALYSHSVSFCREICHLLRFIHHTHLLPENITLETQEYELHVKCMPRECVHVL